MPIIRRRLYTKDDIEKVFRSSEYRPTTFRSQQEGHTFTQHIGISNEAMLNRWDQRYRDPRVEIVAVTAFPDNFQACQAGMDTMNSAVGQQALAALDQGFTGLRVQISHRLAVPVRIRYALAGTTVRTIPWEWFRMVVDRNEAAPYGIHVQTFFAFMSERPQERWQPQR